MTGKAERCNIKLIRAGMPQCVCQMGHPEGCEFEGIELPQPAGRMPSQHCDPEPGTYTPPEPHEWISSKDTAKMMRKALKESFGKFKFSVRSDANSIRVRWVDGPNAEQVDAVVQRFRGGYFDGMTDYQGGYEHELNGKRVKFAATFVFTDRDHSPEAIHRAIEKATKEWGQLDGIETYNHKDGTAAFSARDMEVHRKVADRLCRFSYLLPVGKPSDSPKVVRTY